MDTKTKIHTIVSLVLVAAITGLAFWAQTPSSELKADILSTDTVLVRIQDFAFDPDVVRIDTDTTVSWLHDEPVGNAEVQHTVTSYDPEDAAVAGEGFDSDLMSLGDTFSRTFSADGVYYYNCSLHPFMTGKICVGEASELLDEDCAVELTDLDEEVLADDELDPAADEDYVADDDDLVDDYTDFADDDDDDTEAVDVGTLTDEEAAALLLGDEPDTDTSLFDAADEEFESDTLNFNGEEFVFVQPEAGLTDVTSAEGGELADSGPEHLIYLLFLAIAFYGAKKLSPKHS